MTMEMSVAAASGATESAPALSAEDRAAVLEAVRDFAAAELAPHALEWDLAGHFPRETLERAGELGLGGIYVREDVGGTGLGRRDAVAIFEELAQGDPSIAAFVTIHNMVAWMIDTYGSEAQRRRFLPELTAMRGFGSYCLTEPGAGSDAAAITTSAIRDGAHYVLTGVKQFISGAGEASVYVVMARTGEPGARGISAFLVPGDAEGLLFGPNEKKMGWKAQPTRQVILDEVRVGADALLGTEGRGFAMAMSALDGGRLNAFQYPSAQHRLQVGGLRGGPPAGQGPVGCGTPTVDGEDRGEQVDDAGLSIGSGHAHKLELVRRPAMGGCGHQRHGGPNGRDHDGRHRKVQRTFTDHSAGAGPHGCRRKVVTVVGGTRNAAEHVSRPDLAGVVGHAGHLWAVRIRRHGRVGDPGGPEQGAEPHVSRRSQRRRPRRRIPRIAPLRQPHGGARVGQG